MPEDESRSRPQFKSLLENFPGIDGGVVYGSLLHQNAVENVVAVVEEHTKESLLGLPSDELFEIGNHLVRVSHYRPPLVSGP